MRADDDDLPEAPVLRWLFAGCAVFCLLAGFYLFSVAAYLGVPCWLAAWAFLAMAKRI